MNFGLMFVELGSNCTLRDASKKTEQRDVYFATQLDMFIATIKRVEDSTLSISERLGFLNNATTNQESISALNGALNNIQEANQSIVTGSHDSYTATNELAHVFLPYLHQEKPISLSELANETIRVLNSGVAGSGQLRKEVIDFLWDREWTLDSSMADLSATGELRGAVSDLRKTAEGISKGLYFESISGREAAVSKTFESTYNWIFQRQPRSIKGRSLWDSLPIWLESDSYTPYWITGKPGSGKSTIMKFIAQHHSLALQLSPWAQNMPVLVTSYYAWNAGYSMQKTWEGLKKTVLFQALDQNPALIPKLAPRRWALVKIFHDPYDFPPWQSREIDESFSALLAECGKTLKIILFIDGLDEFDVPPSELVTEIRTLTSNCHGGLKCCVASRPWTEFDDAFSEGPMVQMHLLTQDDMTMFVQNQFSQNKGYVELQHLHPRESAQLTENIVSKALGVFLWVSLVTETLLRLLTEGDSIVELQQSLEILPSDLSSLYDAIWTSVPGRLRSDASAMIQLVRTAYRPMQWLLMWLADESRSGSMDTCSMSADVKFHARRNLKRRLATRTRGLLEIGADLEGLVDFSHRTARDWSRQPGVWESICSSHQHDFDPFWVLLKAETLMMTDESTVRDYSHARIWEAIIGTLWYAGEVKGTASTDQDLVQALDKFDEVTSNAFKVAATNWPSIYKPESNAHWSSKQDLSDSRRGSPNTFIGITAQLSILPYIQAKVLTDPKVVRSLKSDKSIGLLENAIFGHTYFTWSGVKPLYGQLHVDEGRRLDTVKFLMDNGAKPSTVLSSSGVKPIKEEVLRMAGDENAYYTQVASCMEKRSSRRSASRLSSAFRDMLSRHK